MFGHKRLGALVALLREEKADNSMVKTGKEKLVRRDVSGLTCVGEQENLIEKGVFIMGFLAGIELMWDGLSSDWFASPHPSPHFSNVLYYNPINPAQGKKHIERKALNL